MASRAFGAMVASPALQSARGKIGHQDLSRNAVGDHRCTGSGNPSGLEVAGALVCRSRLTHADPIARYLLPLSRPYRTAIS
eukprot:5880850-Prymnesium_polylepis.1